MKIDTDVLIIGGGMAGLVAGIVSSESGLDTTLLRKGQGATSMSSGAVDIIGYMPDGIVSVDSPIEGIQALNTLYPLHPYSILGFSEDRTGSEKSLEIIAGVVEWFKERTNGTIASLIGDLRKNMNPITVIGTTKPTCLVQKTMYCDDLNTDDDNVLLFAGIKGYADFNPSAAASAFLEGRTLSGEPPKKVGHCTVDVAPFGKPYNVSSIELARHFDHSDAIDSLAEEMKDEIDLIGVSHVALPPVIGLKRAVENKQRLEETLNVKVFELLSFPPSIPGLRLQMALESIFSNNNGNLLLGFEAISSDRQETRISSITAKGPRRSIEIKPKAVVLASGKFIGGGLYGTESGIRETVFDLMTVTENFYSATDIRPPHHTGMLAVNTDGHEIFGAGLSVDPLYRPIDSEGKVAFDNLFAAGSIIAGYNYSTEKSGLGVALVTGYSAGINASNLVTEVS